MLPSPRWLLVALLLAGALVLAGSVGRAQPAPERVGSVRAWGANHQGQLGNRTTTSSTVPLSVAGPGGSGVLRQVVVVAAGADFSLALALPGIGVSQGYTWGVVRADLPPASAHGSPNLPRPLADGFSALAPLALPFEMVTPGWLQGWEVSRENRLVDGGPRHVLAIGADGKVRGWGGNHFGELGDGTTADHGAPVGAVEVSQVVAVAAGGGEAYPSRILDGHSLVLGADGSVYAWGRNEFGQAGGASGRVCTSPGDPLATGPCSTTPRAVAGLADVVSVDAGNAHSLAARRDGSVWSWGSNLLGQLGRAAGETCLAEQVPCSHVPGMVPGLQGVTSVAAGADFSLALRRDGTVWAWGSNEYGQLGVPTTETCMRGAVAIPCSTAPVPVSGLAGAVAIAAGRSHGVALLVDGTVRTWGANRWGQLGAPTTQSCSGVPCSRTPVAVLTLGQVVAIAAGESHNLAIVAEGPLPPTPTPKLTRPPAPSKLRRALKGRQVTLTWKDNATNESYVAVERATQAAAARGGAAEDLETSVAPRLTYTLVKKLKRNTVSFRETLKPGTYYYRVRACNAAGCSKYAGPLKVTVK